MRKSLGGVARTCVVVCLGLNVWAQGSRQVSPYNHIEEKDRDNPRAREQWFARGRTVPGGSPASLRYRAYMQKMLSRQRRAALQVSGANLSSATPWIPLGPAPLASDAGNGQNYNWVAGRATAVAIDPADSNGNTVFLGGANGGVWKSSNAGPASVSPADVIWTPVADNAASLAVGAIAIQPGNANSANSVVLAGTGEPNSSIDSYYGLGILRSSNGGATWNLIAGSADVPSHPFAGLGFSKIAFSTRNPQLVVAAAAGASEGVIEGLENPITVNRGIYVSADGGQTWKFASLRDGAAVIPPGSVTSVVYNAMAAGGIGAFFAAVRYHGIFSSTDGMNWTRLPDLDQPANLTVLKCPSNISSSACPFYRAELAVVPGRNEMYTWVVYLDNMGNEVDGGIWQSLSGGTTPWSQVDDTGIRSCGDPEGCGVEQGIYNLELLALPSSTTTGTDVYAGAINLYRCTMNVPASASCSFQNLTHVYGSCASSGTMHPDQHHLAGAIASGRELLYFANDGGIYRVLDGYTGLSSASCGPFDSLNQTLGSMTQFVSFSIHPADSGTLLGGTQDNGSPATSAATGLQWQNVHPGDGGYNAILPASPNDWFTSYPDTGSASLEIDHCGNGINCNALSFQPVVSSFNLGNDDGAFYFPYILDPQAPSAMLVGTCRIWRVQNAKSPTAFSALSPDFEPAATPPCNGSEVNLVRSIAAGGPKDTNGFSKVIYAGTDGAGPLNGSNPTGGRIFVTTDASAATPVFNEVEGGINPEGYPVSSMAVDSSDASGQTAYVGIMGFHVSHVFKTTNAGALWTDFTGSLPDAPVNSLLVDSGVVYAGTDVGVFASSTLAASWSEVGPAPSSGNAGFLPNVPVTALRLFSSGGQKLLRASTYGRGVWQYNVVTTPDYALVVQNSPLTVFPSQTGALTGKLISFAGYNSGVALSCSSGSTNPPGSCTAQSSPVTPSTGGTAFQINVTGATGDYAFNVHGTGQDGSQITHDAPVTVHVVDFTLGAPNPASISAAQGGTSNGATFIVSAVGSFSGTVTFACTSGLPHNAACNFSPQSAQPTASSPATVTLTITAQTDTPAGSNTVIVSATTVGAPAAKTRSVGFTVSVPPPDYALKVGASSQTAIVNQSTTFQGTVSSLFSYASAVNLSCAGDAPPTCNFSPATITPTATGAPFTLTVGSNAVHNYAFAIQGAGTDPAQVAHTENVTFNSLFTFALADMSGPQTVKAGQSASYGLSVTPPAGVNFPSAVTFTCAGLPAGASCSTTPTIAANASGAQNVTLTISTQGPNHASVRPIAEKRGAMPFLVWISAAGLVIGGVGGRNSVRDRTRGGISIVLLMALIVMLISCGGSGGSAGGTSAGGGVTISVSPSTATLYPGQTKQFTATVAGNANTGVSWTASMGSVDSNGLYTAPASVSTTSRATVTAVAMADVTKSDTADVTIQAPVALGSYTVTVTAAVGSITQTTTATLNVQQ